MRHLFFTAFFLMLGAVGSALGSPFTLGGGTVNLVLAKGSNHGDVVVPILPASSPGFDFSLVTVSSAVPWLSAGVDVDRECVVLRFNAGTLANGNQETTVTVSHGADGGTIPISLKVRDLNATKLLDDPRRSRMYGIHSQDSEMGGVVLIDPVAGTLLSHVSVGKKPTDLALSNDGSELFVINTLDKSISVINVAEWRVSETILLTSFTSAATPAEASAKVGVGPGNVLYYTDGAGAPVLRVFDRVTKQVLQSLIIEDGPTDFGFGDFELNPTKTRLYAWAQFGWSAGSAASYLANYEVSAAGTLTLRKMSDQRDQLRRDPLNAPVLIPHDGKSVFVKKVQVSAEDVYLPKLFFPSEVFSISPGGEVAATETAVYETRGTGAKVRDLPVATKVQAFTSDYTRLVYFDPVAKGIRKMDLVDAFWTELLGRRLTPAIGSSTLAPEKLTWWSLEGAERYQVYLGASAFDVQAATPASSLYLGETLVPEMPAPTGLVAGSTYHWRVDTWVGGQVVKGTVLSFSVSALSAGVSKVEATIVQSSVGLWVRVPLSSSAGVLPWSVTVDKPWVQFEVKSGTTPAVLEIWLDPSALPTGMPVGVHRAVVTVRSGLEVAFTLPVELTVEPLKVTHLKSDPQSSTVYAISEMVPDYGRSRAYLLEVDAETGTMLRMVPVGESVTDLCVHVAEGRLYLTNWKANRLLAYNKTTLALEREYEFPPMTPLAEDPYYVAAGKAGRVMVSHSSVPGSISLFDTVTGSKLRNHMVSSGAGAYDPSGDYYYHGRGNSSGGYLFKLGVSGDVFTPVAQSRLAGVAAPTVLVSEDGSRVFWAGIVFDEDMKELCSFADSLKSISGDGRLAFSRTKIYNVLTEQALTNMPVTADVSAYNNTVNRLVVQNGTSLQSFNIYLPQPVDAPVLTVAKAERTRLTLSWPEAERAQGYRLQYRASGAEAWTTLNPAPAGWTTQATIKNLQPSTTYEIRMQLVGTAVSSLWSEVVTARTLDGKVPNVVITSVRADREFIRLDFEWSVGPNFMALDRATSEEGPWERLFEERKITHYDATAKTGVTYYYRVISLHGQETTVSEVETGLLPHPVLTLSLADVPSSSVKPWNVDLLAQTSNLGFACGIQRRLEPDGEWVTIHEATWPSFGYADWTVSPEKTYSYRFKTLDESRTNIVSQIITVTTPESGAPKKPLNFRVSEVAANLVRLEWQDGAVETGYKLQRARAGTTAWGTALNLAANTTSYVDTGVSNGLGYYYRLVASNDFGNSPYAVSEVVVPQALQTVFEDDFDPNLQASLWPEISVSESVNLGAGFNDTKALYFTGGGHAQTRPINIPNGGVVAFSIRAGNAARDGANWADSVDGEVIHLEYSIDGTQWTSVQSLSPVFPALSGWSNYSVQLPPEALSTTTRLRWRHESSTGAQGPWALDNVRVSAAGIRGLSVISQQPLSTLVVSGSPAQLTVAVTQPGTNFQWYKNGVIIPEATAATYAVAAAVPADGALYKCLIHSPELGGVQMTNEVYLGVVECVTPSLLVVDLGADFDLEVKVHPADILYPNFLWHLPPEANPDWYGTVTGKFSSKLSVKGATKYAHGAYQCWVSTWHTPPVFVDSFFVRMNAPPRVHYLATRYYSVGDTVDFPVTTTDPQAVITVTGLPKGLAFDPTSGRVKGQVEKPQSQTVTVVAKNIYGVSDAMTFPLHIILSQQKPVGSYRGVFKPTAPVFKHGGQISFQINAKGTVTGSVTLRGKTYRFTQVAQINAETQYPEFEVSFKEKNGPEMVVGVVFAPWGNIAETTLGIRSETEVDVHDRGKAVRNPYISKTFDSTPEVLNVVLPHSADQDPVEPAPPRGVGFLNMSLKKRGAVLMKGRLADGQVVTTSTFITEDGLMPMYVDLYRGTGSFVGEMKYAYGEVSRYAYWGKDAQPETSKDRVFKGGFGTYKFSFEGGPYVRLKPDESPLAGAEGLPLQGYLYLRGAGLDPEAGLVQAFTLNRGPKAVLPRGAALNPHKFTLKLNPATGVFNGTFNLDEGNPAKPGQMLRRPATFYGCVAGDQALGFFLLPELPEGNNKKTPIWSGSVELLATYPEPEL